MSSMIATRDAYGEALAELGAENGNIVALDADLSGSTKTGVFAKKFPDRFFNMGIAEANMVGTAAGLAAAGKIPFVSTFAIFAVGRAWEQMRQSVAYPRANVKIVATHGGGTHLPTQQECLSILGCVGKGKVNKLAEIIAGVVLLALIPFLRGLIQNSPPPHAKTATSPSSLSDGK